MQDDITDMIDLLSRSVEALQMLSLQPTVQNVNILHATHQALEAVIDTLKTNIEQEGNADV